MAIELTQPRLFLGVDSAGIETFAIAGGIACAFTKHAPGKDSDNEDSLGLVPCGEHTAALLVADGLGGLPSGDQASAAAIHQVSKSVTDHCNGQLVLREAILDGIEQSNKIINEKHIGSGTTLAAVGLEVNHIRPYHVGDSAILITGQRGKIVYQSIPHSPVGYAVEAGLIEADEAIYHEERHLLSNMIGSTEMRVEIGPEIRLAARDTLVIASDGLFDNLQIDEIVNIIRIGPLDKAAENLAKTCRARMTEFSETRPHKPDDLAFILFRLLR